MPNATDIMEQSQSNIDNKSFRTRKTEIQELKSYLFAHPVGAGQIQFHRVRSGCFGFAHQFLPIVFVERGHDTGDQDLFRVVPFDFFDRLQPILLGLFRDQFNVQKGLLVWPKIAIVARCASDDAWRHVCDDVCGSEQNKRTGIR
jgi:hypothetical protein